MAKTNDKAAQAAQDPAEELRELRERLARLERATGKAPEDAEEFEAWKAWASLPAADKTALVCKERFKADFEAGLGQWDCELWRGPDEDPDGPKAKRDETWPAVRLPAHSAEEARQRYLDLCGIRALTVAGLRVRCKPAAA